ncbi:MAG TPA: tryptophan synthase subunit alpha [Candidatus Polarisedimenticolia bacterium]|nr:tryptophan synthase subunit alpha [Candidatus Polarisedimenticolia bacterium]
MSRIARVFETARGLSRPVFIPFITCGDPVPAMTAPICEALERAGAGIIELGVPFSDPLADGPTIQRSSQRALAQGIGLRQCLALAAEIRGRVAAALVLFTYYNPILRMGEETFVKAARDAGLDGVLVTDLPLEEGGPLRTLLIANGIDPILLVAPTTAPERIAATAMQGRGFIYYVSRTGVTGQRESLPRELAGEVTRLRKLTSLPVAVGFGISRPEHVRAVGNVADAVVVGSALVAVVESALDAQGRAPEDLASRVGAAAAGLTA